MNTKLLQRPATDEATKTRFKVYRSAFFLIMTLISVVLIWNAAYGVVPSDTPIADRRWGSVCIYTSFVMFFAGRLAGFALPPSTAPAGASDGGSSTDSRTRRLARVWLYAFYLFFFGGLGLRIAGI
jgi:hypothetical protein